MGTVVYKPAQGAIVFLSWQKKLGRRYGLGRAGNEAAGIIGNCFVVLADGKNVKTLKIVFPDLEDEDVEFIENLLGESKIKKFEWREREIFIRFAEYLAPYSPEKIAALLDGITAYFSQKHSGLGQNCHNCGSGENCGVYAGMGAQFLCENCFAEKAEALDSAREEYEKTPANYVAGFLGALLFALPGTVVAVILFVFLDTIAAVSTLLCMVLARKGYKQFRGKISPAGAAIISVAGVIMTVVGIFAGYAVYIVKLLMEEGYSIDLILPALGEVLKVPELFSELVRNIVVALLISAVYVVLNFWQTAREWKFPEIKKAEEIG
jgi:hypothetical protein